MGGQGLVRAARLPQRGRQGGHRRPQRPPRSRVEHVADRVLGLPVLPRTVLRLQLPGRQPRRRQPPGLRVMRQHQVNNDIEQYFFGVASRAGRRTARRPTTRPRGPGGSGSSPAWRRSPWTPRRAPTRHGRSRQRRRRARSRSPACGRSRACSHPPCSSRCARNGPSSTPDDAGPDRQRRRGDLLPGHGRVRLRLEQSEACSHE